MIELEHVSYTYEDADKPAVRDVTMHIPEGAFTAILGRNGCGKSTLAKMMNGLFLPTVGTVRIGGMDTRDESLTWTIRQNCGMIFQNPDNQLVATVVRDDVAFGLENIGLDPASMPERIEKALRDTGMSEYIDKAPHLLSGGQKQRVAIAGILAMEPRVILCDEATAMLDPQGRAEVFETLRRLNREKGITVVWITHFMEEAAQCRDICVFHDGSLAARGTPEDIFSDVEQLKKWRLEAPMASEIAFMMRARGIALRSGIMTMEELAQEVAKQCV